MIKKIIKSIAVCLLLFLPASFNFSKSIFFFSVSGYYLLKRLRRKMKSFESYVPAEIADK